MILFGTFMAIYGIFLALLTCYKVTRIRFFVVFRHFLMLFGSFITYLVVLSLYLAITKRKNIKRLKIRGRRRNNVIKIDKVWIRARGG